MQTNLLLLILVAATLLVLIYLVFRVKAVLYLLQQPVVKKMSPQLRLKPVKLDEAMNRNGGNRDGREGRGERRDENRGERRDGDRNRGEGRGERREGGRPEGRRDENRGEGRGERRDENRGERREGGRPEGRRDENRGEGRGERRDENRNRGEGRGERRDENRGERRPPREFSETRDFAPAVASEAAPASEQPALSPRRPLATFDAPASESVETSAPAPSASETFVGSSDDMQHGRRTQLKKKPRFDIEEDESTAA